MAHVKSPDMFRNLIRNQGPTSSLQLEPQEKQHQRGCCANMGRLCNDETCGVVSFGRQGPQWHLPVPSDRNRVEKEGSEI